jgi:hypothetical protein
MHNWDINISIYFTQEALEALVGMVVNKVVVEVGLAREGQWGRTGSQVRV